MGKTHTGKAHSVAAVVVTYNPDPETLEQLLNALAPQVDQLVVVDNASENATLVTELAQEQNAKVFLNKENLGIAAAQNKGIAWALKHDFGAVLLSDQDSLPSPDMVSQLKRTLFGVPNPFFPSNKISLEGFESETLRPIAAVGPVPVDERGSKESALVYSFTTWGPWRGSPPVPGELIEVPFVPASGSLLSAQALRAVGPMNEALFIDHVDLAWCLRALSLGYRIVVDGSATLTHSLGEDKAVLPTGREVHLQSPFRNYYMVRNTLWLMRAPFMPTAWKLGYLSYLAKYLGFYTLAGLKEPARLKQLLKGVSAGLK